jgi:hypothetical protein
MSPVNYVMEILQMVGCGGEWGDGEIMGDSRIDRFVICQWKICCIT